MVNGTASNLTGGGTTYAVEVAPTSDGSVTVSVGAGAAVDAAGNPNAAVSTALVIEYDSASPTVTVTTTASDPTNVSPIPVAIVFNEAVREFDLSDVAVVNGTASNLTGGGTTYAVEVAPTSDGSVTVSVGAGAAVDAAGNPNAAVSTALVIEYDSASPTVTVTTTASDPTNVSPIPVAIVFNEAVREFDLSDVAVVNGTASNLTGGGTTYAVEVAPTSDGSVTVSVGAGAAVDAAGNPNAAVSTALVIEYDSASPTVTVTTTASDPTNVSPIPVAIVFNEAVREFDLSDVAVVNGTASNLTGGGTTYAVEVAPTSDGSVTVSVGAGAAVDAAGNPNAAVSTALVIEYDSASPTVTVTTTASDPTNVSPIPVAIVFNEAVREFDLSDVAVVNGTASNLTGGGTTYAVEVAPTSDGSVTVSVGAGAAVDAAGNPNAAVSTALVIEYDSASPTVTVTTTASDPTNVSPIPVAIVFNEAVREFDLSDVAVVNGTASNLTGGGTTYAVEVAPTSDGSVTVSVGAGAAVDAAGNPNAAVSTALVIEYDSASPTVTVTTTASDPTNVSPIPVAIVFNEAVREFDLSDVAVVNGTASNLTGGGTTYAVEVAPTSDGSVTVSVGAGAAVDAAGNPNAAVSTALVIEYDSASPTVTVTTTASDPTNVSPIPVAIVFNEAVREFDLSDVAVVNGTASNLTGGGTTYAVEVAPTSDGSVTVSVGAGAAVDAAGNPNAAVSTALVIEYDSASPTVTVTTTASDPTNVSPIPVAIVFNEAVREFDLSDVAVVNGTASNLTGGGTTYAVEVAPTSDGSVTVSVGAGAAVDAAGNGNTAATQLVRTYDTTPPSMPEITTDGGMGAGVDYTTGEGGVSLSGTCSADTVAIFINGSAEYVTYTAGDTSWSYSGVLEPGENVFWVVAYDEAGNASDAGTITITFALPEGVYYVDAANGTDDLVHGSGYGEDAWRTVHYAVSAVNSGSGGIVIVYVSSGVYGVSGGEDASALSITRSGVYMMGESGSVLDGGDGGYGGYWSRGLEISGSDVAVSGLRFRNFETDIFCGSGSSVLIEGNDFEGGGSTWTGIEGEGTDGLTITGNRIIGTGWQTAGVYLNGCTGFEVFENEVEADYGTAVSVAGGDGRVERNRLYASGEGTGDVGVSCDGGEVTFEGNLVRRFTTGVTSSGGTISILNNTFADNGTGVSAASVASPVVKYNIFAWNSVGGIYAGDGAECDYNCFWQNGEDLSGGCSGGDHDIFADPGFVSTEEGSEDYGLKSTSPCVDMTDRTGEGVDLEGVTRPQYVSWEMGAYEVEAVDTDGDGLPDYVESGTGEYVGVHDSGTDPGNADTDGDGRSDGAEVLTDETDPVDPLSTIIFTIVSTPQTGTTEDAGYSYQVSTNSKGDVTYALEGSYPDWIVIDPVTGIVSALPTEDSHAGGYTVTIVATDEWGYTARQEYTLTISRVNDRPVLSMVSDPVPLYAMVGKAYTLTVLGSDEETSCAGLSFETVASSGAPSGMSLTQGYCSSNLWWVPSSEYGGTTLNGIEVRVVDGELEGSTPLSFDIEVLEALSVTPKAAVLVRTTEVVSGEAGDVTEVEKVFTVTGGLPYSASYYTYELVNVNDALDKVSGHIEDDGTGVFLFHFSTEGRGRNAKYRLTVKDGAGFGSRPVSIEIRDATVEVLESDFAGTVQDPGLQVQGTVSDPDTTYTGATITVPADSSSGGSYVLSFNKVDEGEPYLPEGGVFGDVVEIKAESEGGDVEFSEKVEVTIPYGELTGITNPSDLRVYTFDPEEQRWVMVEDYVVDTVNKTVTFRTSHFSLYTLGQTEKFGPSEPVEGGVNVQDYRMLSFPCNPDDSDLLGNLEGSLGSYDDTQWRCFAYNPSSGVYDEATADEFGELYPLVPGLSYWLITRKDVTPTVKGLGVDDTSYYETTLHPGWNMIGNPFSGDIYLYSVMVSSDGVSFEGLTGTSLTDNYVWAFDPRETEDGWDWYGKVDPAEDCTAVMKSYEGYWLYNYSTSDIVVRYYASYGEVDAGRSPGLYRKVLWYAGRSLKRAMDSVMPCYADGASSTSPPAPPSTPGTSSSSIGVSTAEGGGGCFVGTASGRPYRRLATGLVLGGALLLIAGLRTRRKGE